MRTVLVLGLLLALSACAATRYRNVEHPSYGQAEFDRDAYECDRENRVSGGVMVPGGPGVAGAYVDQDMAARCMALRGWRAVSN